MTNLEYTTVTLEFKVGFFDKMEPDFASTLNAQAEQGWRLVQVLEPAKGLGETSKFILVLERPKGAG